MGEYEFMDSQQNIHQKNSIKHNIIFIALVSSILIFVWAIIGSIIFLDKTLNINTFYEGIIIDGIPIGNLTVESAKRILEQKNQSRLNSFNIRLVYKSKSWELSYKDFNASLDMTEKITQAYNLGREGNILKRYLTVTDLKKHGYAFNSELFYDMKPLRDNIEKIASEINITPIDATVIFKPDFAKKFQINPEKEGLSLNVEHVLENIKEILISGNKEKTILLVPDKVPPKVFSSDFSGITERIVTFGTDLSMSAPGRTNNVVKAAYAFNGMVVMPGDVISFNDTTGERTLEKGYSYAPMISNNRFVDVPGGGVSQTSTTLYNTVIRAGLEVIEWNHHSIPSSYVDKGLDTTVNLPSPEIDLKFRNNKKSPIYIRAFYTNKKIYFEIYGEPLPNGQELNFYSEVYETIPPPVADSIEDYTGTYVEYEDEKHIMVQSREGYNVRVYRQILENDQVVKTDLFENVFYSPIKGIIHVGVKKRLLN